MTERTRAGAAGRGGLLKLLVVTVVAFVAGALIGATFLVDAFRTPCWQVEADLKPARDTLSETFGAGEEGAAALATIAEAVDDRPDCFSPTERASLEQMTDAAPSQGGTTFPSEAPSG